MSFWNQKKSRPESKVTFYHSSINKNVGNLKAVLPVVDLNEGGTNRWPCGALSSVEVLMGFSRLPGGITSFLVIPNLLILEYRISSGSVTQSFEIPIVCISTDLGSLGFKMVCFLLPSGCLVTKIRSQAI